MFDIWKNLKDLVQVSERKVYTINAVFILHSKVTVVILLALSILVTSRQYLSDPIECLSSADIRSIADKYCWIHSTYTRKILTSDGKWGYEAIWGEEGPNLKSELPPGIRPAIENDTPRIYHSYYQWVWLVLFLQAGLFYLPYWLWRLWDRGRIKLLVADLNLEVITSVDEEDLTKQKEAILSYLAPNQGRHTEYAVQYIICEILNTVNVIGQIFVTDAFLNWSFSSYGLGLFSLSQMHPYQRDDDLARVFPTVTACRIATGGVAFGTMEYDILCVLPINILNEKIYIFLWFLFLGLAALSIVNLIYRALLVMMPPLRRSLLRGRLKRNWRRRGAGSRNIVLDCSYADWFMLSKLGDNLNPVVFAEILEEINDAIKNASTRSSFKEKLAAQIDLANHKNGGGVGSRKVSSFEQLEDEETTPLNKIEPPPVLPIDFLYSSNRQPPSSIPKPMMNKK